MEFLQVPDSYYDILKERLKHSKVKIAEELNILQVLQKNNKTDFILKINRVLGVKNSNRLR